jgi:hypothetical protein
MWSPEGRCYDCDGHYRHFDPCPEYTGEPALPVEARVALQAGLMEIHYVGR